MGQGYRISKWQRFLGRVGSPVGPVRLSVASRPVMQGTDDDAEADTEPGDWAASTFDLLRGADITEYPDTVTDALLDELFRPAPADRPQAP